MYGVISSHLHKVINIHRKTIRKYNIKLENYFNTLDKNPEGIFDYIMARKKGRIENRKKS
ncbi:hypothetical protein [uncultured Methanobrevibacter sp.]|uniref:hypothetical protein n=1 Tax=uncultured Methanobrevibacter sp. TaxID=253161 RepID=UPI0025F29724|nr:hypothetical protein [uncultured Methanobrevibacter sp.]